MSFEAVIARNKNELPPGSGKLLPAKRFKVSFTLFITRHIVCFND